MGTELTAEICVSLYANKEEQEPREGKNTRGRADRKKQ